MKLKIELSEELEKQLIVLLKEIALCLKQGRETPKPEFKIAEISKLKQ